MIDIKKSTAIFCVLCCLLPTDGSDKYTDENRPYEFGFTIDGEQHRHEQKDEKGLIMGEFGFITADGVYHVTVYATDENGNFKILSMKNIRVKPYPTAPAKKGHSLPFPPSEQQPVTQRPTPEPISLEPPIKSCAFCSIPTTKKPQLNDIAVIASDPNAPQYPQQNNVQNYPLNPPIVNDYNQPDNYNNPPQDLQPPYGTAGERNPKQFTDYPPEYAQAPQYSPELESPLGPNKPTLISANMQIVDKNTEIYQRGPGEKEGLPPGLDKKDMMVLLYVFNYTVGFHGHYEEGYTNGVKKGYYFVTGRNGVKQRVDYIADENGYRPTITQEVLDIISEEVPKPETEKSEKYGLKGYEFKWLYYPVESKKR